jgi:hypothetical protein
LINGSVRRLGAGADGAKVAGDLRDGEVARSDLLDDGEVAPSDLLEDDGEVARSVGFAFGIFLLLAPPPPVPEPRIRPRNTLFRKGPPVVIPVTFVSAGSRFCLATAARVGLAKVALASTSSSGFQFARPKNACTSADSSSNLAISSKPSELAVGNAAALLERLQFRLFGLNS